MCELLRGEALDVRQDERDPVVVRQRGEDRAHVFAPELLQEVEVKRVRIRERVLIGDPAVERELVELVELDLDDAPRPGAGAVAARVDEDRGQPRTRGRLVAELVELAKRLQQTVLHRILGVLAHEASRQSVEPRQLLARERAKSLLC